MYELVLILSIHQLFLLTPNDPNPDWVCVTLPCMTQLSIISVLLSRDQLWTAWGPGRRTTIDSIGTLSRIDIYACGCARARTSCSMHAACSQHQHAHLPHPGRPSLLDLRCFHPVHAGRREDRIGRWWCSVGRSRKHRGWGSAACL